MDKLFGYEGRSSKERKVGQKITMTISYFSYFCSLSSAVLMLYYGMESTETPLFASLLAMTVFFLCVGVVLHVLGSGNLPSLKVDDHPEQQTYHREENQRVEQKESQQSQ